MNKIFLSLWMAVSIAAHGKTITEYFLELPAETAEMSLDTGKGGPPTKVQRKEGIKVRDDKNGYLEFERKDMTAKFTLALFKRKSGAPWVAVNRSIGADRNLGGVTIYEPDAGWKDVTGAAFPVLSRAQLEENLRKNSPTARAAKKDLAPYLDVPYFRLPRKGTTISVVCGTDEDGYFGVPLGTLEFNGEKFTYVP